MSIKGLQMGGRDIQTLWRSLFQGRHYYALWKMMSVIDHPWAILKNYLFKSGSYPSLVVVKTPRGKIKIPLYSHHDLLTVNEIFCREDYRWGKAPSTVVDFGSNIGISALYFLTRNPDCRLKLFEPLEVNIRRLKLTLSEFENRYELYPVAVGLKDGEVEFDYEDTGRYGGIAQGSGRTVRVPCRHVNTLLNQILQEPSFETIDLLKIDIEGYETQVLQAIDPHFFPRIKVIVAEIEGESPALPGFEKKRYGSVVCWRRHGGGEGK